MGKKKRKEKKLKKDSPQYTFSDEVTKNKIRRHLKDIKDVITDDDIARAKIPGKETRPGNHVDKNEEKNDNTTPEPHSEGKPATPWDVID